jgi:hypothetical protein
MKSEPKVEAEYDSKFDILYMTVGDPTPSEAEDIANNVYVRYDVFTNRLAGAIIMEYSKRNKEWLAKILPKKLGKHLPNLAV